MKIGFFGDSYANMIWHNLPIQKIDRSQKPWSYRLFEDLESPFVASGKGGTNQFYAIQTWLQHLSGPAGICDCAVFTFTWEDRLYSEHDNIQDIMCAEAEVKVARPEQEQFAQNVRQGIKQYREFIHSSKQTKFVYELMIKWILDLPKQYPNTKFIFLPNTEFARQVALKHFTNGVLVNFTFESLSNFETNSPGIMPVDCGRVGHLNNNNHEEFTMLMKSIIKNYQTYNNKVLNPDLSKFDLVKVPNFV